jgi:hypothetical protein
VPGQLFQGGFSVEVGTTSVHVEFRDFSLKDGDLGMDLFLDGTMTVQDPGSVYSVSFDLFVDNLLEGRGLYLNGLDLTVEDLGSSLLFTMSGRIYDTVEGCLDVETLTPVEMDIGSDYPKSGEVRFTGANGSSFRGDRYWVRLSQGRGGPVHGRQRELLQDRRRGGRFHGLRGRRWRRGRGLADSSPQILDLLENIWNENLWDRLYAGPFFLERVIT